MQDVHPIGGGGARMFAGGSDRRMRQNHHHAAAETAAALKCPRCDSPNTKFCYYNNYNLSQPRHYCKSCRRYWTKGGVLRNVPVGGSCRKAKRSNNHKTTTDDDSQHSEDVNCSIAEVGTTEVAADPQPLMDQSTDGQIFQELGSFTTLMTSPDDPSLIDFTNSPDTYRLLHSHLEKGVENDTAKDQWGPYPKMDCEDGKILEIMAAGVLEDATQSRRSNGGLSPLDWQIGGAHRLFDLTGTVDQSYWNDDHTLNYLP